MPRTCSNWLLAMAVLFAGGSLGYVFPIWFLVWVATGSLVFWGAQNWGMVCDRMGWGCGWDGEE